MCHLPSSKSGSSVHEHPWKAGLQVDSIRNVVKKNPGTSITSGQRYELILEDQPQHSHHRLSRKIHVWWLDQHLMKVSYAALLMTNNL